MNPSTSVNPDEASGCEACMEGERLDFAIRMAFQPIVDVERGSVFGYEALVRGAAGESAAEVLSKIHDGNRYRFDQACRVQAVRTAARLNLDRVLSINFLPNAVYRPEACIRTTLHAARTTGFPPSNLMFEVTEGEKVSDQAHLAEIFREYKRLGFRTAIDDFGAGYSGLNLLAAFQPDVIKIDMALVRGIELDRVRQSIVTGIVATCRELGTQVIAEGVETLQERDTLIKLGIRYLQGFFYALPAIESLPPVPGIRFDRGMNST